jgi:pantetheine-phosphate adenylyltransferase
MSGTPPIASRASGTRAMYPGTFDPVTRGHQDLIRRAAHLFDEVVVAVAHSPRKAPLFDLETRLDLLRQVVTEHRNVRVEAYAGLTVNFAREQGLGAILRGLRAVSDFEYEFQLATMNRQLEDTIETVFMTPAEQFTYISSSLVKEVASLGGEISHFVDPVVASALRARFPDA